MRKLLLILLFLFSCVEQDVNTPCIGNCESWMTLKPVVWRKGYWYHKLEGRYSYFPLYIESTDTNHKYQYNGVSVIEAWFDTNTYWELQDSLSITIPLYKGFGGLKAGPYWDSVPLSIKGKKVYLSQFEGYLVPLVQLDTRIYLQPFDSRNNEYTPVKGNLWGKKLIGPVPIEMMGDTVTIYSKVIWEKAEKIDSIKIIFY